MNIDFPEKDTDKTQLPIVNDKQNLQVLDQINDNFKVPLFEISYQESSKDKNSPKMATQSQGHRQDF